MLLPTPRPCLFGVSHQMTGGVDVGSISLSMSYPMVCVPNNVSFNCQITLNILRNLLRYVSFVKGSPPSFSNQYDVGSNMLNLTTHDVVVKGVSYNMGPEGTAPSCRGSKPRVILLYYGPTIFNT